ncbi:hypothetical protein [Nonomuraea wenchangensis]|uniref:Uncharacterized protein n=1 Tax=Nonomuraea wenchangensis TaxID=568860 RepID=A0A1I0F0A3_9ACTN|nr:hypothetical protein [Nonomuraea wenchangensis]SET51358.1 hypothetical protein SAMN05421811_103275 [Nonomuraea wenchangensis]
MRPEPTSVTLPVPVVDIEAIVRGEFKLHEQHARDRACVDAAAYFEARAGELRANPTLSDPLAYALAQRCHTRGGVVHDHPSLVAAVAYKAVAAALSLGDPTRNDETETTSHD